MKELLKNPKLPFILSIILIFGAVFLLFHELFFGKIIATNDVSTNDLLYFNLPDRALYADALKHGELLQWTPMLYGGFPIFAEGQGGYLYPLNLIIWYLFSPIGAMNIYIIFQALFMGLGVYFFARKITGNKLLPIPSAVAASICGSIIAGHTRHLNSMTAIVFMPWLFYSVELYLRSKKVSRGLIFGVLIGLMFLSGHPQYSFISGFFAVLYLILRLGFEKNKNNSLLDKIKSYKLIYFFLVALVVTVIIIFPQIKATMELIPFTERGQELGSQFTGHGSMPISGLLTFFYPYYLGNAGDGTFQLQEVYFFWEYFHYTGAIIFILALIGAFKMWKRTEYRSVVRPLVIIAIIGYLLATGENLQVYKIFTLFPFTKSFRFPVRWLTGTELSVLVLSGFGVMALVEMIFKKSKVPEKADKKRSKSDLSKSSYVPKLSIEYSVAIIVSLVAAMEIYIVAGRQVTTTDSSIYLNPPSYVDSIKANNKTSENSRIFPLSRVEFLTDAFMKSRGWEGKHDMFGMGAKLLPDDLGAYFNVPIINGYFLLVPSYIYEIWGDANHGGILHSTASLVQNKNFRTTDKFIKLSKLFGVKYLSTIWDVSKPYTKIWDSLAVKAYELPDTMQKAWVVSKVQKFPTQSNKTNADALINDNFNPWSFAYTDENVTSLPAESTNGTADILEYSNHSVKIKANAPGFVVINDTWYPRWKAYIDGVEVPVYKTNVMMRGVVAPKAGTIIEMKFDTGNVFIFTLISYLTVLVCFGYVVYEKRKKSE